MFVEFDFVPCSECTMFDDCTRKESVDSCFLGVRLTDNEKDEGD